jgi:hypothetical protein
MKSAEKLKKKNKLQSVVVNGVEDADGDRNDDNDGDNISEINEMHDNNDRVYQVSYTFARLQCLGYFIVGLFCYICSFSLFVWLFFFTYALLAVVYVSRVEDRFYNILHL